MPELIVENRSFNTAQAGQPELKLLLVGHSFCPNRGSEPGLSWNWASYMTRHHEVWIIAHTEFKAEVEEHLLRHSNNRLHILWLAGTNWDPRDGQRGIHLHYRKWLHAAARLAQKVHAEIEFDVVHYVSLGTITAPAEFWRLRIPFVWGPIGGGQLCPRSLLSFFGNKRWREYCRFVIVQLLPCYPQLRQTVRKSALVLTTNRDTAKVISRAGGASILPFLDNGIADDVFPNRPAVRPQPATVRVLWAGRFETRKALPLALEAFAAAKPNVRVQFRIAGDGDENNHWRKLALALDPDQRVLFLGKLNQQQMREEFEETDIFLFTSVRESFGSVNLEALSHGLPIVTLDLHGAGDNIPSSASIKIPVGSREEIVKGLAAAMVQLAENPELRAAKGSAAWEYAWEQRWSKRVERMNNLYREALAKNDVEVSNPASSHQPEYK